LGKKGSFDYENKACQLVAKNMKGTKSLDVSKLSGEKVFCKTESDVIYTCSIVTIGSPSIMTYPCLDNKDCHDVGSTFSLGEMSRSLKQKLAMLGGEVQIHSQRS
jgi:hypothetical protein